MNEIKQKSLEKIRAILTGSDFQELSLKPINGRMYSKSAIKSVAYGLRNNDSILKALLTMAEKKLVNLNNKLEKIEELTNGN